MKKLSKKHVNISLKITRRQRARSSSGFLAEGVIHPFYLCCSAVQNAHLLSGSRAALVIGRPVWCLG